MGLAVLLVVWLITFVSTYFFIFHPTWMWLPPVATTYGPQIDSQFRVTYIAMGIVFVAAQVALGLFAWKYRDQGKATAQYSHGNIRLEAVWTVLTAILFIGLNLMGQHIWSQARFQGPAPGALPAPRRARLGGPAPAEDGSRRSDRGEAPGAAAPSLGPTARPRRCVLAPWPVIEAGMQDILRRANNRPGHIFNLGHGVLAPTDPDMLRRLVDAVHEATARH